MPCRVLVRLSIEMKELTFMNRKALKDFLAKELVIDNVCDCYGERQTFFEKLSKENTNFIMLYQHNTISLY